MHFSRTTVYEVQLLRAHPLTATALLLLVSGFLRSFFIYQCYLVVAFLVMAGAVAALTRRRLALVPLLVVISYVGLYALHIRGYYELQSPTSDPWSGLRFSMSFMSMFALLAGLGAEAAWRFLRQQLKFEIRMPIRIAVVGLVALLVLVEAYRQTESLRNDATRDELAARFSPAFAVLHLANDSSNGPLQIMTFEPLILQMYGPPTLSIFDLGATSPGALQAVARTGRKRVWLYIDCTKDDSAVNSARYEATMEYLHSLSTSSLWQDEHCHIVRIGFPQQSLGQPTARDLPNKTS